MLWAGKYFMTTQFQHKTLPFVPILASPRRRNAAHSSTTDPMQKVTATGRDSLYTKGYKTLKRVFLFNHSWWSQRSREMALQSIVVQMDFVGRNSRKPPSIPSHYSTDRENTYNMIIETLHFLIVAVTAIWAVDVAPMECSLNTSASHYFNVPSEVYRGTSYSC